MVLLGFLGMRIRVFLIFSSDFLRICRVFDGFAGVSC